MKNDFWITCLIGLWCSLIGSGCAILVIGAAGVTGGYAVSADGIEGVSNKSYDKVWQTAEDVFNQQGYIESADKAHGSMKAKIGHSEIKFKLSQATRQNVVVRVQARKSWGMFPDMNLAKRIYSMIQNGAQ